MRASSAITLMWIAALLVTLLAAVGAHVHALDCAAARLPSSIVICSDSALMRLADERQQAFSATWARLDDRQKKELMADQRGWVRAYATACGIPPDRTPSLPVPETVKECFERAGEARTAYIRAYGLSDGPAGAAVPPPATRAVAQSRIGPSFDCGTVMQPLARVICSDPSLARTDLRFVQAYQALFYQLDDAGRRDLRAQAVEFTNSVEQRCHVPVAVPIAATAEMQVCIRTAYDAQRAAWVSQLAPPARQEATRQIERHVSLQQDLVQLGFLQDLGGAAGVYGVATRAAIANWQRSRGLPVTGFLDDGDASALEQEALAHPSAIAASLPSHGTVGSAPQDETSVGEHSAGDQEVALTREGGTYLVPVRINDAITLNFILDSGAQDVVIPADVVLTLMRTHTVDGSDFVDQQTYVLADGSQRKDARFRLREVEIGNIVLKNVLASITPVKGQPLLGQSFLSRFGSWTLDNKRHVLVLSSQN